MPTTASRPQFSRTHSFAHGSKRSEHEAPPRTQGKQEGMDQAEITDCSNVRSRGDDDVVVGQEGRLLLARRAVVQVDRERVATRELQASIDKNADHKGN